jgi:hypothetical protein
MTHLQMLARFPFSACFLISVKIPKLLITTLKKDTISLPHFSCYYFSLSGKHVTQGNSIYSYPYNDEDLLSEVEGDLGWTGEGGVGSTGVGGELGGILGTSHVVPFEVQHL